LNALFQFKRTVISIVARFANSNALIHFDAALNFNAPVVNVCFAGAQSKCQCMRRSLTLRLHTSRANQMTRIPIPMSRAARGRGRSCAAVQLTLHVAAHRAAITGFPTSRSAALSLQRARGHVASSS